MLTTRMFKVKGRKNNQGQPIPFWVWDKPIGPCSGVYDLQPNELVLLFEPPFHGCTPDDAHETSWLVLSEHGFAYVFLFGGQQFWDIFDECT